MAASRNKRLERWPCGSRGAAVLAMLGILLFAVATAVIARFSLNRIKVERADETTRVLNLARESLLGYAVRQPVIGTLPCPDTDATADGLENTTGTTCTADIGRFPYRTLGMGELTDGSGTPLWYAVESAYTNNLGAPRNSSIGTSFLLDGQPVAAVIIAPGAALSGQQRTAYAIGDYLEGENANASVDTYARVEDDQNNDRLLGIGAAGFWTLMERRVLNETSKLLRDYKTSCGEYPWAADFSSVNDDSVAMNQSGNFPLDTALPDNWNSGCAAGIVPSTNLQTHWRNQLFYHMCTTIEGTCVTVQGDAAISAEAIVIAPGVPLTGQNRSVGAISDYYEDENAASGSPYKYLLPRNLNGNFNDRLQVVAP